MPHTPNNLRLRSLVRALELSGGPEKLAIRLGISEPQLNSMLEKASAIPEEIFLKLVDVLIESDVGALAQAKKEEAARIRLVTMQKSQKLIEQSKALVEEVRADQTERLQNLPASSYLADLKVRWLTVDEFKALPPAKKEAYLRSIAEELHQAMAERRTAVGDRNDRGSS